MNNSKAVIVILVALSFNASFSHAYDSNSPAGDPLKQGWKGVVGATSLSPSFTSGFLFGSMTPAGPDMKIIEAAIDDMAYFVATDGAVRTARFNQAMSILRQALGNEQVQDMELVKSVLAY